MSVRIYLIRHGETAWSLSGQHTGRTDIPLTENGERKARLLGETLRALRFSRIWTSPLSRARRTCELAGLSAAEINQDLAEWDYGEYEGLTSDEIRKARPDWSIFNDGCPGGESVAQISERADRVIAQVKGFTGNVALFSHGHMLRAFAATWIGIPLAKARHLMLDTASISILGYEHDRLDSPVIILWNALCISGDIERAP